jgi:hypothetical protein
VQKGQKSAEKRKKCKKCDTNAKGNAKVVQRDAMGLDKSANSNAKNFSHYHP